LCIISLPTPPPLALLEYFPTLPTSACSSSVHSLLYILPRLVIDWWKIQFTIYTQNVSSFPIKSIDRRHVHPLGSYYVIERGQIGQVCVGNLF
jgi:hypothetical protein